MLPAPQRAAPTIARIRSHKTAVAVQYKIFVINVVQGQLLLSRQLPQSRYLCRTDSANRSGNN